MGKISDALERRKKERTVKLEHLSDVKPERLVTEDREVTSARDFCTLHQCSPRVVVLSAPDSGEAENFRILRGQILYARHPEKPRTIMVTSTFPGEGKSFVACNLTVSLALGIDDYVLVVDCDLRRPNLHEVLGAPNRKGLYEYLTGKAKFQDIIVRTDIEKLSILPAGNVPKNPAELLSSNATENFIRELRQRYEDRYVLLDSPPVQTTAEARILAEHVDGIIFVVMADKSPRKDVQRSIEILGKDKIIGVVFNGYTQARKAYSKYHDKYYKKK
jgi:exopolysaccharide/PEP-CTERM locus tyrosine autokinase